MELRSGTRTAAGGAQASTTTNLSRSLKEEQAALLHQGVGLVLARWTALQLAIHNEWGGPSSQIKAQQLHNDIFEWILRSKEPLYIDELEDILDENLLHQFNTEIEDGSLEEVAETLMSMYEECLEGNFEMIRELMSANSSAASLSTLKNQQMETDSAEENTDHTMATADRTVDGMDMDSSQECNVQQTTDKKVENCISLDDDTEGWQIFSSKCRQKPRK